MLLGASLGLVYAPCAGPILAGVITVSAAQNFTVGRLAVALAYSIGSAIVLYLLMLGGRRITDHLGALRARVQVAMGAVMIAVAVVMIANLDVRFESAIAGHLPSALVDPTSRIEQSSSVSGDLAALHGGGPVSHETGTSQAAAGQRLPVYFQAPNFTGTQDWFNTPGDQPLSLDRAPGAGRPRRLLDLHLHQLHPHAALHRGLVPASTTRTGSPWLASTRPSSRSRRRPRTSSRRSATSASPIPSRRTTTPRPGTRTTTSTGRPTT